MKTGGRKWDGRLVGGIEGLRTSLGCDQMLTPMGGFSASRSSAGLGARTLNLNPVSEACALVDVGGYGGRSVWRSKWTKGNSHHA